jgi:hypothetical protein
MLRVTSKPKVTVAPPHGNPTPVLAPEIFEASQARGKLALKDNSLSPHFYKLLKKRSIIDYQARMAHGFQGSG